MNEEVIDIAQIDLGSLPEKEFPGARKFRILISRHAHEAVWRHARQSMNANREDKTEIVEVGGILIGNIYKDKLGPFLEITAAIVGKHTKNEGTQMTFTPDTWEYVNQVKSKKYPDDRIVGWYHTHPRFGIFLSDMDKFSHRHHFPQPWTTAMVVDPVQQSEGFFLWNEGEPCSAGEYWVGGERRETARPAPAQPMEKPLRGSAPERPPQQPESPMVQSVSAVAMALCFVGLLFLFWVIFSREASHSDTEKVVLQMLEIQTAELQNTHDALVVFGNQFVAAHKEGTTPDEQMQIRMMQAAVGGLQKAILVSNLAAAKLANRQDLFDQLQAEMSGAKPKDDGHGASKTDAVQPNSEKQNADKPDANKPPSDKPAPDKQNQPGPNQPASSKVDTAAPAKDKNTAAGEVKKQ